MSDYTSPYHPSSREYKLENLYPQLREQRRMDEQKLERQSSSSGAHARQVDPHDAFEAIPLASSPPPKPYPHARQVDPYDAFETIPLATSPPPNPHPHDSAVTLVNDDNSRAPSHLTHPSTHTLSNPPPGYPPRVHPASERSSIPDRTPNLSRLIAGSGKTNFLKNRTPALLCCGISTALLILFVIFAAIRHASTGYGYMALPNGTLVPVEYVARRNVEESKSGGSVQVSSAAMAHLNRWVWFLSGLAGVSSMAMSGV